MAQLLLDRLGMNHRTSAASTWTVPPILTQSEEAAASTLASFGSLLSLRDAETFAHSQRVIRYALKLGRRLGLAWEGLSTLGRGVFLHDLGKIHVPKTILNKPGPLSEAEWVVMKRHPATGYGMLRTAPHLEDEARIVLCHHEWYDGTGYPQGLKGEQIPLGARICAVVDMLDALTSARPYRRSVSFAEACEQIRSERETHFDPFVVEAFLSISGAEWQALKEEDHGLRSFVSPFAARPLAPWKGVHATFAVVRER
ncbi:MAG: HD-GYP domain-containing protein [Nitrospirota bacterium]